MYPTLPSCELVIMDVDDLSEADIKAAQLKMAPGKAADSDEITVEMTKALREVSVCCLMEVLHMVQKEKTIPRDWRKAILVLIYTHKVNIHDCSKFLRNCPTA